MSPVEISADFNPLRLPSDRRLNRIAGPSGLVIFGVTGDLDTAPDVAVLADGIVTGLDELVAAT